MENSYNNSPSHVLGTMGLLLQQCVCHLCSISLEACEALLHVWAISAQRFLLYRCFWYTDGTTITVLK